LSFFFFSSRRRHTRFSRDWSSDVCSSDLTDLLHRVRPVHEVEVSVRPPDAVLVTLLGEAVLLRHHVTVAREGERQDRRLADEHRSEERRVGKGRRGWWAADHANTRQDAAA